jgi:hypothetical protein
MFTSSRTPQIDRDDLPTIQSLLVVFDRIEFNGAAEMVAKAHVVLPVFGRVVISFYARECHYKVYSDTSVYESGNDFLNVENFEPIQTRDELVKFVLGKLVEQLHQETFGG